MNRLWMRSAGLLICTLGVLHIALAQGLDWRDVAAGLMSPACPGRTLLNCTSGHAEQWRELIRQKIAQGETKEQIVQYFVDIRGEEILAAPPKRGFALTAWLFPLFIIVNGAGLIVVLTYKWARKYPAEEGRRRENEGDALPQDNTATPNPYRDRLRKELEEFTA